MSDYEEAISDAKEILDIAWQIRSIILTSSSNFKMKKYRLIAKLVNGIIKPASDEMVKIQKN